MVLIGFDNFERLRNNFETLCKIGSTIHQMPENETGKGRKLERTKLPNGFRNQIKIGKRLRKGMRKSRSKIGAKKCGGLKNK